MLKEQIKKELIFSEIQLIAKSLGFFLEINGLLAQAFITEQQVKEE